MKTLFSIIALAVIFAAVGTIYAKDHKYHNSEDYEKIEASGRTHMQNCLNDNNKTVKSCYHETKKMMKQQKKQLKQKTVDTAMPQ